MLKSIWFKVKILKNSCKKKKKIDSIKYFLFKCFFKYTIVLLHHNPVNTTLCCFDVHLTSISSVDVKNNVLFYDMPFVRKQKKIEVHLTSITFKRR